MFVFFMKIFMFFLVKILKIWSWAWEVMRSVIVVGDRGRRRRRSRGENDGMDTIVIAVTVGWFFLLILNGKMMIWVVRMARSEVLPVEHLALVVTFVKRWWPFGDATMMVVAEIEEKFHVFCILCFFVFKWRAFYFNSDTERRPKEWNLNGPVCSMSQWFDSPITGSFFIFFTLVAHGRSPWFESV